MALLPVPVALFPTLHDAVVESFRFEAYRNRLEVSLWLEPSQGRFHRRQQLVFSGIHISAEVAHVAQAIQAILVASGRTRLGFRLSQCRWLPRSAEGLVGLILDIDHLPVFEVRCQKVTGLQSGLLESEE